MRGCNRMQLNEQEAGAPGGASSRPPSMGRSGPPGVVPLHFHPIPWPQVDWSELESYPDRSLFQSRPWLEFVARTQRARPRIVVLRRGHETVGFFTYLVVRRAGLRIAGSPFKGWTTDYLGFNVRDEEVRDEALRQVSTFLFKQVGCAHFELVDRKVDLGRAKDLGLEFSPAKTYEIDLTSSEEALLEGMHASTRRYIRRAEKRLNVVIEACTDSGFVMDYYSQLVEVFARQGLVPTYGIDRVRALVDCLMPSGDLLLLRARDRAGGCMATGIFPARRGTMHFWGGATRQEKLKEHPNEPLHWHAMRYWRKRGMTCYDMGGGGEYKENYGGVLRERARIRQSRNRLTSQMRDLALWTFKLVQRIKGWRQR